MSKIYTYQTYLRIILTANVNVSGALATRIYYKKPSGTINYVDAEVHTAATGILYYDLEPDSAGNDVFLDECGKWRFWTYVLFNDGRAARGEVYVQQIYNHQNE